MGRFWLGLVVQDRQALLDHRRAIIPPLAAARQDQEAVLPELSPSAVLGGVNPMLLELLRQIGDREALHDSQPVVMVHGDHGFIEKSQRVKDA